MAEHIEINVSDGSDDDATGKVAERLLASWLGRHRYIWNHRPGPALVDNLNRAIELATGEWTHQLHDDYLLPDADAAMLDAIHCAGPDEQVLLSGVRIVDPDGVPMREQSFRHERYLEPTEARRRLLRNSSYVQHQRWSCTAPARTRRLVRHKVGEGHRHGHVGLAVLPLRHSVRARTICAYMIHEGATTDGIWNPGGPGDLRPCRRPAARAGAEDPALADRLLYQFILAGAYRRLRARRMAEGREALRLFELPEVRRLGLSPKWLPVRAALIAATAGARWRT